MKAVVAVGALVVTAVVARRTSDATRGRLLATLVVAAVVAMAALSQGPSSVPVGAQYQVSWLTALTGLAWLTVVAFAGPPLARAVRHLVSRRWRSPGSASASAVRWVGPPSARDRHGAASVTSRWVPRAAVALLAMVAVLVPATGRSVDADANDRTAALVSAVRDAAPPGTYVVSASGNWAYLSTLDAVALDLLRRGDASAWCGSVSCRWSPSAAISTSPRRGS